MKKTLFIVALFFTVSDAAAEMSAGEYFTRERNSQWTGALVNEVRSPYGALPKTYVPRDRQMVARIVERQAQARLGAHWAPTAIKIAKIENNFRCATPGVPVRSHGGDRAQGAMQVMPRTARAMGFDPRRLHECEYGIAAGIEHMRRCIAAGVRTHAQMAACHISGWAGWNRRLARKPEQYKQHYIRLAMR